MTNDRNSSIDLLRIISMLMVIGLHYVYNIGIEKFSSWDSNYIFMWTFEAICYVSVNCFVLITGYFGSKTKKTNYKRVIDIGMSTLFYSWICLFFAILSIKSVSVSEIYYSVFPLINGHYWFVTVYLMLMILKPLVNKFLDWIIQGNMKWYFIFMFLFCIIPTFFPKADPNMKIAGGTNIIWFVILYVTGGLIANTRIEKIKIGKLLTLFLIGIGIPIFVKLMAMYVLSINQGGAVFYHHNSAFIFMAAVSLFVCILKIEISNSIINHCICWFTPTCIGVYLIHENLFIKPLLWKWVDSIQFFDYKFYPIFIISAVIMIFISCSVVDKIRIWIFNKTKITDKVYDTLMSIATKISKRV